MNIFTDLQQSAVGTWVRESPSLLGYPTFLFLHTVGLGLLVGTSVAISLRILGFGRRTALSPMVKVYPLTYLGFWISFVSGFALWLADAELWSRDILFYIKLGFVVLGMITVRMIRKRVLDRHDADPLPREAKFFAVTSLLLWLCAITAGRLTAYIGK